MKRLTLTLVLAALGCGSADDKQDVVPDAGNWRLPDTRPADAGPSAASLCYSFRDEFCIRLNSCSPTATVAECREIWSTSVDCGAAVAVSASYDRCVAELKAASCAVLFPAGGSTTLPASCAKVILLP